MSNWFRFYDDVVNDPKLIRIPDELFRAWVNLLCIAAKNDGVLPELADVALILRVKEARAAEVITKLVRAKLLDDENGIFVPHNWQGRQFKSDDSGERVKRHRAKKRSVTVTAECNVTHEPLRNAPEEKRIEVKEKRADARTDLQKRVGDFRQAIVQAYAEANSPTLPETSRAEMWIAQGYQEDICLAVVAERVRRKPNASLAYFDEAIAEAHAKKAPPRKAINGPPPIDWDVVLTSYKKFGHWSRDAGNDPGSPNCRAPPEILRKYGIEPVLAEGSV